MFAGPIPARFWAVQIEASEQFPSPGKGAVEGIDEETLAETPGSGEEEILAFRKHGYEMSLIDIGIAAVPDRRKGLDADGKLGLAHCRSVRLFLWAGNGAPGFEFVVRLDKILSGKHCSRKQR